MKERLCLKKRRLGQIVIKYVGRRNYETKFGIEISIEGLMGNSIWEGQNKSLSKVGSQRKAIKLYGLNIKLHGLKT